MRLPLHEGAAELAVSTDIVRELGNGNRSETAYGSQISHRATKPAQQIELVLASFKAK
jgi:hypothetical protein